MDKLSIVTLILLHVCRCVDGDVTVRQKNDSTSIDTFSDASAAFGPSLPDNGITGYIYNVSPRKACEEVAPPPDNTSFWIALISRDNCTFSAKVRNVEKWYAAAIIYNTQGDKIFHMPSDGTPVHIPSVFVGEMDGKLLERNYCYNCRAEQGKFIVTIDANDEYIFNPYLLWPFAVVVGTCFVLMLVFIFVKWCRDVRRRKKSRLPSKYLKKIPTKKFKKGDEYDCCAICLDDYEEGDKLRLLPCSHVYHTKCIDPWLTKNKRSCPICKRKVIPGDDSNSDSDTSDNGEAQNERTPLLASSSRGNNNNTRRSTFENSGLPAMYTTEQMASTATQHQGQTDSNSNSDQSDTEVGAVGGVTRVKLSKENLMTPLKAAASTTSQTETQQSMDVSNDREAHITIETSQGSDNHGFVVDGEDEESEEDEVVYTFPDSDVVFSDSTNKEEKKFNGVV